MIITRGGRKRPYKAGRSGLTKEMAFPLIPQSSLTDRPIILEGDIEGYHVRRIYVYGGSSSEIIVGEKQNYATGVRNSKVSLTLPHDNGKDEHKKPRGCRFHHLFNDQVFNAKGSGHNANQQRSPMGMQTDRRNA
ncbi:hypothetical protein Tco_1352666 [Tanacetum coccineum]